MFIIFSHSSGGWVPRQRVHLLSSPFVLANSGLEVKTPLFPSLYPDSALHRTMIFPQFHFNQELFQHIAQCPPKVIFSLRHGQFYSVQNLFQECQNDNFWGNSVDLPLMRQVPYIWFQQSCRNSAVFLCDFHRKLGTH